MINLDFSPFPKLHYGRLKFRAFEDADVHDVFALRSNPEVMKYIPRPLAKNLQEAMDVIKMIRETIEKKEGINWVLTLKDDPKMIGMIGIYRIKPDNARGELGYILLPEFHNQGYITEAIKPILIYAFHHIGFHSLEAVIDPANISSERVLQKNGFVKEAHLLENEYWDGRFLDTIIYSLLKRNFKEEIL